MTCKEMIDLALEAGFAGAEVIGTEKLVFDPMFRPFCEENLCGQYGLNHSCPPDCGTPEQMKLRILTHSKALVLQTIWEMPDLEDKTAIKAAKLGHNTAALRLMKQLRQAGCPGFLVGASGCALCSPCARKEGKPCTFPEQQYSCMSAYCIFVKKLADEAGLEYSPADGLVAFFGMYVFDD